MIYDGLLEPGDPKESCVDVDHAVFVQTQRPSTLTVVGQRLGMTLNDLLFIALVPCILRACKQIMVDFKGTIKKAAPEFGAAFFLVIDIISE